MKIGEKIKYLRIQNDWSQEDLSKKLEMAQTSVSAMERGAKTVTLDTLDKLSQVFGVDKSYFIEDEATKENETIQKNESMISQYIDFLVSTGKITDPEDLDESQYNILKTFIVEEIKSKIKKNS